ncbi:oxidative stress-responsive serine-rich protein 1-like [Scleropages formosus]|uniref:Oxidative stress-responsive serine-rich protein 1 n=1 Tax=Scleropages formosus TaxID=113540 RepID=A0A0P7U0Q8_SCLFO|nr:oxidative stress-responsive serine-rich protein 1 isoform X2 [Scleropages formosus]XP_018600073.1 oxidative stress-responsive serine-rich protein 1 isoform X2 [Scleropages formosus]XP_018600074.1 oxidative stress-responsive serine-rich protein 1 isoform X2 [Scleropages formosus]KPP63853.1 oxidative stress-responsive serine-rich protein 1-like [Scleropages formosus]
MESTVKDCEEETLQSAFKKLRVDAESSINMVRVCEALSQRMSPRTNSEGAKSKVTSPKENWHGCMRKTSRGAVRSQRRRRSKSPILHPPKFTYCSSKMSPPPGNFKHKSLSEAEDGRALLGIAPKKDLLTSGQSSPVFGAAGYESYTPKSQGEAASPEIDFKQPSVSDMAAGTPRVGQNHSVVLRSEKAASAVAPSDFQSLSKLHETTGFPCQEKGCQCQGWQGVEVYSFTGLRDVISECERNLTGAEDMSQTSPQRRTQCASGNSGSPRSCSEQARAYVDDITIEDLSGYMEYYLYIPKKMSHMAEMMYT